MGEVIEIERAKVEAALDASASEAEATTPVDRVQEQVNAWLLAEATALATRATALGGLLGLQPFEIATHIAKLALEWASRPLPDGTLLIVGSHRAHDAAIAGHAALVAALNGTTQ